MTNQSDEVEATEPQTQEVKQYIAASIHSLQMARLDTVKSATLENLVRGRNPYFLRARGQAAHLLMSQCLDCYLASMDKVHFEKFSRELAAFTARRGRLSPQPSDVIESFAHDALPLRIELLEAYDKCLHRLLREFYLQLCNEDATINWERLTRFISESDAQENVRDSAKAPL